MQDDELFGFGSLTMRITPQGIPIISVDGEAVGQIESIDLRSGPVTEGTLLTGKVVVVRYSKNSSWFIELLERVPWLKVEVEDMITTPVPAPITLRTGEVEEGGGAPSRL